ncbi:Uncharacterised protein [Sphingomonas paucimobilis]|nr:Uncharacterised protein [Sphingomonas paucimobilis]
MIVDAVPRTRIIIAEVWRPLLALFIWDVIVTIAYYVLPFKAPSLPLTLFGTALALFLGSAPTRPISAGGRGGSSGA